VSQVLELKNVVLRSKGQIILDFLNWTLQEGDFVGLIGPNGAGKTVLLKVLLGLIPPTSGEIRILGNSPTRSRSLIGYVPQYARFDSKFPISVREVVLMGRLSKTRACFGYTAEDRKKADEVMEKLELDALSEMRIGKLSGGQIQRVLIARALASDPKLLLLDEPTASLDTLVGSNVYDLLEELSKRMTIILVSHDIGVISAYVKTVACLNRKLHYHGKKEVAPNILAEVYGCPIDLIAHGHAHRVLHEHDEEHSE